MTVTQILQRIHRIYEGNTDYPESTDDDYLLRLGLINDAIQTWASIENVKWRELYTTKTGTISGTTITTDSTYVEISSFLKIGDLYYSYKQNDDVLSALRNDTSKQFFYVTGSPGSYVINVNPTPTSGATYSYSYYKTPTEVDDGTDTPEMSKPLYIVYYVLARLYEIDGRNDMLTFYEQKANDMLSEMIALNDVPPFNNEFKSTDDDLGYKLDGVTFGE